MTNQDLRNHIKKSCGFGVETPRTADPNERNETGPDGRTIVLGKHYDGTDCWHADICHLIPHQHEWKPLKLGVWYCECGKKQFSPYVPPVSEHTSGLPRTPIQETEQGEAVQVCSAGEWPEDMGGNWTPDRIAANHSFSDWLDQQGDSIVPSSFSEWLGSEDSIFIE